MATVFSDLITTNALPDAMRVIYSSELEFTTRPSLIMDQPEFVEVWNEFGARRGNTVVRTVYEQLAPTIAPLSETQDVDTGALSDHQITLTVQEYGTAMGTTEALDVLSYHGPISSIVKTLLAPQMGLTADTLARNALWNAPNLPGGVRFRTYANNVSKTSRASLASTDVLTADMVRAVAYRLNVRQVPIIGGREPSFVALAHPAAIYDLRLDSNWKDAQLYAGATRIFNGEEGMIHGVRFLKSVRLRLPNGGALNQQTTLASGTWGKGTTVLTVASASGFTVGQEVTVHRSGTATTAAPAGGGSNVTWVAPNGTDPVEEHVIVTAISSNNLTVSPSLKFDHVAGDFVTEALDVYPLTFLGGVPPLAKGVVIPPEVRVSLPTDKLRRMYYVGWYSLFGYGVARDWAYEILEVCSSQNVAPVYGAQL